MPFDLTVAPLMRATLLRLAEDDHVLLLNTHHIISDGWSLGVLLRELAALYEALSRGWSVDPAGAGGAVRRLCGLAAGVLAGETLDKQLAYWKQATCWGSAQLELPTDRRVRRSNRFVVPSKR